MSLSRRARATVIIGAVGAIISLAPMASQAWQGTTAYTSASCFRGWLSSTVTYGGDAANYTINGTTRDGLKDYYYFVRVDAYLKHNGANADFVREDQPANGDGRANPRDTHADVSGDRSWTVDVYGQEAPGKTSTQMHRSCVIT